MFDTNIFNKIVKTSEIDISCLEGKVKIYATHIQYDELNDTPENCLTPDGTPLRQEMLKLFASLTNTEPTESSMIGVSKIGAAKITGDFIPTESALWGISKWGQCKWGSGAISQSSSLYNVGRYGVGTYGGDSLCKEILEKLNQRDKRKNNPKDALIADTAMKRGFVLITNDVPLYEVVTKDFQCEALSLDDLMRRFIVNTNNIYT
jgi:hypothetical protein